MRRFVFSLLVLTVGLLLVPASLAQPSPQLLFAFSPSGFQQLVLTTGEGTVVIDAYSTGWWDNTGFHQAANTNYAVGYCAAPCWAGDPSGSSGHDYFAFDLAALGGQKVTSAILNIGNPLSGYLDSFASALYSTYDVSTANGTLTADGSGQVGIYGDLGSGTLYGSYLASAADDGSQIFFSLSQDAIDAINAAAAGNQQFAIGGSLQIQDVTPTIPEPGSLVLMGSGLLGLAGAIRRKLSL